MKLIFKKLENVALGKEVENKNSSLPVVTKASSTWGADEEFNYERASRLLGGGGIPQPTKLRTYEDYAKQYGNNIWVYAAVYQIAISLASVELYLYKKPSSKAGKRTIFTKSTHPLVSLFSKPNPFMSQFDLKEAIGANLELTGNAYLEEVYNKKKELVELYPLQSHKVEIVPDKKSKIGGYIYKTSTQDVPFREDEITHINYFNPTSDFYGMGAMSPAEITISTDNFAKQWNRNFFKNSALPKGALETDNILDSNVLKRLKTQWNLAHKGVSKSHNIAILEGGLKWKSIEASQKEMDFKSLSELSREEILASFGVPAPILGIVSNVNNSVLDNLKKLFWENTMLPKLEKIEAALNFNLVWPNDDSLSIAFDKDSIEALKGSQETRARIASMLVERGIFTQNEARAKFFNMPDVPWGDTFYMPLNLQQVDKAGEGLGTGTGAEGDKIPGRGIGRPGVGQEDLVKLSEMAELTDKIEFIEEELGRIKDENKDK
jgi:HK97 family phage portal protein